MPPVYNIRALLACITSNQCSRFCSLQALSCVSWCTLLQHSNLKVGMPFNCYVAFCDCTLPLLIARSAV